VIIKTRQPQPQTSAKAIHKKKRENQRDGGRASYCDNNQNVKTLYLNVNGGKD